MSFNPAIHNRHSIRLQGYDYSQSGAYFITINTFKKEHLFGEIVDGNVQLSTIGRIAHEQWLNIPNRFPNVTLDEFIIMPNHMHGIIIIHVPSSSVGAGFTPAQIEQITQTPFENKSIDSLDNRQTQKQGQSNENGQPQGLGQSQGLPLQVSVGKIVGAYKSLVNNECLKIFKNNNEFMGKIWQRNYYEHIIRDETDLEKIVAYIEQNPQNWNV